MAKALHTDLEEGPYSGLYLLVMIVVLVVNEVVVMVVLVVVIVLLVMIVVLLVIVVMVNVVVVMVIVLVVIIVVLVVIGRLCITESKNPAYGRQRISRPMRIVGPIQFSRGCLIYLKK